MYNFNYMDCFEKSVLQAGFTILMGKYAMPDVRQVVLPFLNSSVPMWVFTGTIGFVASHINDSLHTLIKPETHLKHKGEEIEALTLGAIVGAATFIGSLYVLNPEYVTQFGGRTAAIVGAGGDVLASVSYNLLRA